MDFLINSTADITFFFYPFFLIALFASPFVVTYLRRKKITFVSGLVSTLIGLLLVALALYGTYWGLAYLQGEAFKSLYGLE